MLGDSSEMKKINNKSSIVGLLPRYNKNIFQF